MRRLFLFAIAILAVTVSYSFAGSSSTTYYVSPAGSDSASGSSSAPWQTISRVDRASLQPGDTVLFQGGQTFSGATLTPPTSGTSSSPITFGSYGTGQAIITSTGNDVWLNPGSHDLVFNNLNLTGSSTLFASAGSGSGAYDITIQNSSFHDSPNAGINIAIPADHDWTVTSSTFNHLGDSAIFIWGSNVSVTHSTISDAGWNPAITWGKHGIYDKGPNSTIAYDDFSNIPNGQAVSLRFHGARVYGNTIHDTPYGVGFFDDDTAAAPQGTDYVYDNRLWNITGWGFYYSSEADPQGNSPTVGFIVASNTFSFSSASEAVNVSEVPSGASSTLANNVFTGSYGSAYRGCATCGEFNNDWYGGSSNIPSGTGDLHVNPSLSAAPALALAAQVISPLTDAGTTNVSGLTYTAACDGAPLDYCGSRPDLGAVEATTGAGSSAPAPQGGGGGTTTTPTTTAPTTTAPTTTAPTTTTPTTSTPTTTTPAPPVTTTPVAAPPVNTKPTGGTAGGPTTSTPETNLPSAPGSLHFAPTRTGGVASWSPATGTLPITGYRVLVNGNIVAVTTGLSETLSGLPCQTHFSLGVAALNSAGHVSDTLKIPARTAYCGTHGALALKVFGSSPVWKMVRSEERRHSTRRVVRDAPQLH